MGKFYHYYDSIVVNYNRRALIRFAMGWKKKLL